MHRLLATLCVIFAIIATFSVSAKPTSLVRPKRQSDQRLAELETLLALQKYGRHRFRPDRKDDSHPGYGVLDFNLIGRRKKSTRYSPGEEPVWSPSSLSRIFRNSESETDPSGDEKIDSLISFPSTFLIQDPDQDGTDMEKK